jgi:hypothetical protein
MSEEIAGLFVSIQADTTGLVASLEETRALLGDLAGEGGLLGALPAQTIQQTQQIVNGVQSALAPLPQVLQAGLRAPIEGVVAGLNNYIAQQTALLIGQVRDMAAQVTGLAAALGVPTPLNMGAIEGRAEGGPVYTGQPYLVGERGPELFIPGGPGTILPTQALSQSSGAGLSINGGTFHIYGVQDPQSLYDQLQAIGRTRA